jgi:iron complex transport system ATP-binding protein
VKPLVVSDLRVERGRRRVLDGVDFVVERGRWVSVVGPNGAGKTTLLHAIAGLVDPCAGRAELFGRDTRGLGVRERARHVALVPQNPIVRAEEVLDLLDVHELAGRAVETLSGGERQRVLLARALLQDASVLLLDEPTTALDIGHQQEVLELVDSLRRQRSLAVVSALHDLTLAGFYADELVLLDAGRVVERGAATEVLTAEHVRRHFGANVRVLDGGDGPVVVPYRVARKSP